jgi:predicted RNase H-like HicB family nuclease
LTLIGVVELFTRNPAATCFISPIERGPNTIAFPPAPIHRRVVKYLIVVEKTDTGDSAYSPDLDGCVATGPTREEVERAMREAIEVPLDGLRSEGQELPAPQSYATYLEIAT